MYSDIGDKVSRFTARDLKGLGHSLTTSPLRVVALIDFDAFYAQCETVRLGLPKTQPLAVQQWNILIAVNYPAKAAGVTRLMSPDEARSACPQIVLQHVATWREGDTNWSYRGDTRQTMMSDKAALDPYRVQSRKAFELVKSFLPPAPVQRVEKASVDEIFIDLSIQVFNAICERYPDTLTRMQDTDLDRPLPLPPKSTMEWQSDNVVDVGTESNDEHDDWDGVTLHLGSAIIRNIRQQIYKDLEFTCSAGIACSKVAAKLAAGHNKPNQQTVIRARALSDFFSTYKMKRIRGLGGKLGQQVLEAFGTDETETLLKVSLPEMRRSLGNESGSWVYNVIRGIDLSKVVERTLPQSMLSAKTFVPKAESLEQADKWLRILAGDLVGRLDEQDLMSTRRRPRTIVVHHAIDGRFGPTKSKQAQIPSGAQIDAHLFFDLARKLLIQIAGEGETWPCLGLSVGVSDFEESVVGNQHITSFFTHGPTRTPPSQDERHVSPAKSLESPHSNTPSKRKRGSGNTHMSTRQMKMKMFFPSDKPATDTVPYASSRSRTSLAKPCTKIEPYNAEFSYLCPKCSAHINGANVLEHLDWHVAKELEGD